MILFHIPSCFAALQSMQLQRQAMEQRLGSNCIQGAAATTATQGFLTRQRQTSMRGRSSTINQGYGDINH